MSAGSAKTSVVIQQRSAPGTPLFFVIPSFRLVGFGQFRAAGGWAHATEGPSHTTEGLSHATEGSSHAIEGRARRG